MFSRHHLAQHLGRRRVSDLAKNDHLHIVIIAPESRVGILQEEFGRNNLTIEGIGISSENIESGIERLMRTDATNLLNTRTRAVQRKVKFANDKIWPHYIFSIITGLLGNFRAVRGLFRFLGHCFVSGKEFDYLFRRCQPSLLFATDVFILQDLKFLRGQTARHQNRWRGALMGERHFQNAPFSHY